MVPPLILGSMHKARSGFSWRVKPYVGFNLETCVLAKRRRVCNALQCAVYLFHNWVDIHTGPDDCTMHMYLHLQFGKFCCWVPAKCKSVCNAHCALKCAVYLFPNAILFISLVVTAGADCSNIYSFSIGSSDIKTRCSLLAFAGPNPTERCFSVLDSATFTRSPFIYQERDSFDMAPILYCMPGTSTVGLKIICPLQRPKKSQLSGLQTFTRKNFPDEVRKLFSRHVCQKRVNRFCDMYQSA